MKIILLDGNAPWVRSLFAAMKDQASVYALNVRNMFHGPRPPLGRLWKWERQDDGLWIKPLLVPGWTRFRRGSTWIVRRAAIKAIRKFDPDLVVYTLPFYADVAAALRGKVCQVYFAHDPFRFYDWDVARTMELEREMLTACDGAMAISRTLAEDLQKENGRPVFYCPNAVSGAFLEKLAAGGAVAEQLQSLPRPIVGCIGQINRSYDWKTIGAMADALPHATFVFVGPIIEPSPEHRGTIDEVFCRSNVKWLGPRPHAELPGYLRGFDVCLNPLAITEHNDRRSPLRLYDYLATDRPILSTAGTEALAHGSLIQTFSTVQEGIDALRAMLSPDYRVDRPARTAYIRENTWEARAEQFLSHVRQIPR